MRILNSKIGERKESMKLTDEQLEIIKDVYIEIAPFIMAAKSSCPIRSAIPAMVRSLGKRDGLPNEIKTLCFSEVSIPIPIPHNVLGSTSMVDEQIKTNEKLDTLIDMLGQVLSRMK